MLGSAALGDPAAVPIQGLGMDQSGDSSEGESLKYPAAVQGC